MLIDMNWPLAIFVIICTAVGFGLLWLVIFRPIFQKERSLREKD